MRCTCAIAYDTRHAWSGAGRRQVGCRTSATQPDSPRETYQALRKPSTESELPQSLEQLHHRPRVPLTIRKQVLTNARPLIERNLLRHEQESRDLHARYEPVHDHEIGVRQLRHQRREHVLETEAPAEIRVIHVVAQERMHVDQLALEPRSAEH